ncbi:hypothetical protein [thiotrophic endosymbiont of Bathymodiolus puteoserpentis (Logatchev)]|nr:hypothetical protein [thiotrophic endosymbiont of Bathymodiolus puteoserpentis (Logatchev)]CAC9577249.1 hypothetical protein [uncultured Gammaproteobacteria bacterium]CAC9591269.1 hypothetical protein [uncultured Gammaproteobacteria bacterium]CAC9592913.1 hypothetical protein [uncultured Gammaproteobacteria bacterium]CAC9630044.1 hypothetical protein [uncultured Gammaproteobacteria bacterium]CAC9642067.1 hypothetical protein [uncultured Gammaproteobacteria bacterium]
MNSKKILTTELKKTIEWYLANTTWCKCVKEGSCLSKSLGAINHE